MLTLFSKAIDECKSSAVIAKKFVGNIGSNIETRKWSLKKKKKDRAYQVTVDDDDEYVSWGSDFDESCSDDGTNKSGRESRTGGNFDNNGKDDDYDINEDDEEDDDVRLNGRCGSYSLSDQTDGSSSHNQRVCHIINGSSRYDNTYEAISETPSTSSYSDSENSSSCFYSTPPERRKSSCASDKSSSGIGGMNGSTRSNSADDRSNLSSLHFDDYTPDEKRRTFLHHHSHQHNNHNQNHQYRDSHHRHLTNNNHSHHPHQLSVEVTSEYILSELARKKRSLLNGCAASSETSSGQCSRPSSKPRSRPLVKPEIPPKPNIAQINSSKPASPGSRRKVKRKIVRPTGEPPPPPVPKSPPPISPASSKASLTDRLAEITLDDLNEVFGVQLSSEPEDNEVDYRGVGFTTSRSPLSITVESSSAPATNTNNRDGSETNISNNSTVTITANSQTNHDQQQQQSQLKLLNNQNLTKDEPENQNSEMGLINAKLNKNNQKHSESTINSNSKVDADCSVDFTNQGNSSSSLGIDVNSIVNKIMGDGEEDFGDYETPLNFKGSIAQQVKHLNNLTNTSKTGGNSSGVSSLSSNSSSSSSSTTSSTNSSNGCTRMVSRSSSVASGSFLPDSGFSDCTGISPYPISPPPPFDDNYCCSCRRLMKSVGSTPNLNATRSSSRSEMSLLQVTTTTPSSSSSSSAPSMRNQAATTTTTAIATTNTTSTAFEKNSLSLSSNHHHHYHHHHHHHHKQQQQHQQHHSHSHSNLSMLTVDRPKLPRSKPDCGSGNSTNNNNNNINFLNNNIVNNSNHHNHNNNNNNNSNNSSSSGISLKAEIAAKFAEKAAYAKKIINSRPPFKPFESIYATGKSFGFSSSSSSSHKSSSSMFNFNNNISRSGSTCSLAQRPLPPLPDDVMPIEKYSWFHGLERDAAVTVLEHLGTDGSYLVRPSKRAGQSNPLTLSILHEGKVFHLNIRRRSDGLYCLGKEKDKERTFASVPALIRFHQKEPILLTTKGESAGITKLMVTPILSSSSSNPTPSAIPSI